MKRFLFLSIFIVIVMNSMYAQNQDFLFMVEQAVKAPSGHNTQPWLFKLNEASIEIHPNLDKSLPVVDFDNRELFIALGCATENLCIAASCKGYKPTVSYSKNGIITVGLTKDCFIKADPLFRQISIRQTNRNVYNGSKIPEDTIAVLNSIRLEPDIHMYFYANGTADFDSIADYVFRGNTIQMRDKAFKQELRKWMRYNRKHQDRTNDGLSYAVFGAPNLPMFIVRPIMSKLINEKSQNKSDKKKIRSSSHLVLFTTQGNTVREWIDLGRSLERLLLKSTESGIRHAYLNQPNEIRGLSLQMAEMLNISGEYPTILLRLGYAEKLPYSKRKKIEDVIISD